MTLEAPNAYDSRTCRVDAPSSAVHVNSDMTLQAYVSHLPAHDLGSARFLLIDQTTTELEPIWHHWLDETTAEFAVRAPDKAGIYTWTAVLRFPEEDDTPRYEISDSFTFTVTSPKRTMVVWGAPSAVTAGDAFTVNVGVKCITGCRLSHEITLYNHEGTEVASATPGEEPWPGTEALYVAQIEISAPEAQGPCSWVARVVDPDSSNSAAVCSATFGTTVVGRSKYDLTFEVVDSEKQTPIAGIHVLLHPFRAFTDEQGVAVLRVPEGKYEIRISGYRYIPHHTTVEVTEGQHTRVALDWEPEMEPL